MGVVTRDVKSISKSGEAKLKGDITISGGANITLTQTDQDISIAASGSTGAPSDAQYLTLALDGDLDNERVLVGGTGIDLADGGANNNATLTLDVSELGVEASIAADDYVVMEDITDNGSQKITFANLEGTISHANLADLSTGADHSYIDQDVTKGSTPTLTGTNITGLVTASYGDNTVTSAKLEDDLVFGTFPLTPSSAPDADYEVANKKYVDDNAGGGGDVATDTIWDAKGDIAGGTGADTADVLSVGTDGDHLVADSGETTGLKWTATTREKSVQVCSAYVDLSTGDGKALIKLMDEFDGMDLVDVTAEVTTAPTGSTISIQVRNVTDSVDILSTPITIDAGETSSETAATAPVIDTDNDDIDTNDLIAIDIDQVGSSEAGRGLVVGLRFA